MKSGWVGRGAARWDRAFLTLLAVVASVAGLLNDFVYDDIPLIRDNAHVHSLANWREILTLPYWPPPFVENLYRPLSLLIIAVEYALGGGSPLIFRIVSYVLYAASTVGVFALASRLVSRRAALAATALFAVHPVHVEAVALGVGQGELLVGIIAVAMVCHYVDRRRAGGLTATDWTILAALYAAAALTKENGFILPGILLSAELFLLGDEPLRARAPKLFGGFAALAAVGVALLAIRTVVLSGRLVGATPNAAFAGLDVGGRMFTMLQVVPMWLRLLVWPQRLQVGFAPGEIATPSSFGAPEALGLGLIVTTFALIVYARRHAPVVSFGLTWCIVALLPVSNIVPTGILLAERTLFVPSIGFVLALAAVGERAVRFAMWTPDRTRQALTCLCTLLVVLGLVRSANRQSVWNTAHLKIANSSVSPIRP